MLNISNIFSVVKSLKYLRSSKKKFYKYLKNILHFPPENLEIYELAFIHKSASLNMEDGRIVNNERLEYLGDAILGSIVADYLYIKFPNENEGFLTQMRSRIVSRESLNLLGLKLGFSFFVVSNMKNNRHYKHIYGDTFESLIGAIYVDKGYKITQNFIIKHIIQNHLDMNEIKDKDTNYKSQLVEWGQKFKKNIYFETSDGEMDENDILHFISHLKIETDIYGTGEGKSKKEAEQKAALEALKRIRELDT